MSAVERRAVPFAELVFVPGNPNRLSDADQARLEEALSPRTEGGARLPPRLLQPILVRPTPAGFEVVDGEHRARACAAVGLLQVEAVVAHGMSAAEARALRVGMNKLRGSLDLNLVAGEVRLLAAGTALPPEVLALVGFDRAELDAVLAATQPHVDAILGDADGPGEEERAGPARREAQGALLSVRFERAEDRDRVRAALAEVDADPARALLSLLHAEKPKKRGRRGAE